MKTYTVTLTEAQLLRLVDFLLRDSAGAGIDPEPLGPPEPFIPAAHVEATERAMKRASRFAGGIKPQQARKWRPDKDLQVPRDQALAKLRANSFSDAADGVEKYRNSHNNTIGWDRWLKRAHPNAAALLWPNWGAKQTADRRAG